MRQRRLLVKAAGTARYAFNWGLSLCKRLLNAGKPVPHAAQMHRAWNAEKPQRSWVYGVSKCCGQEALRDLDRALANFWRGRKAGRRIGFPRFRRKHGRRDSFRLTGSIRVHPPSVSLPRIGCVRVKEATSKFRGRILSATVSRRAAGRGGGRPRRIARRRRSRAGTPPDVIARIALGNCGGKRAPAWADPGLGEARDFWYFCNRHGEQLVARRMTDGLHLALQDVGWEDVVIPALDLARA